MSAESLKTTDERANYPAFGTRNTRKKKQKKKQILKKSRARACCLLSGSVGRLFNLMSTQQLNARSRVLLKEHGRRSAGEQTVLDVVWTHTHRFPMNIVEKHIHTSQ